MRTKISLKKLVSIGVAVYLTVASVGCFDLGDFSDESAYYAAFDDVRLVYQNPNVTEKDVEYQDYSVKDYFYNKNTGEDFKYGDPKDSEPDEGKDIPQLPYVYMAIPVERDLNLESLALYFNALQTCSLEVYFYVVDELPDGGDFTNIRLLGEPEYQQKLDENKNPMFDENNQPIYERVEYSDPSENSLVGKTSVYLTNGAWDSLVMDNWNNGKTVQVSESQYLLLRFVNNGGANTGTSVPFRVTNLLIRAVP
jgi:hypothetical protein